MVEINQMRERMQDSYVLIILLLCVKNAKQDFWPGTFCNYTNLVKIENDLDGGIPKWTGTSLFDLR